MASLLALKSLPCPHGDRCQTFMCLFGHPRDQQQIGEPTATTTTVAESVPPAVTLTEPLAHPESSISTAAVYVPDDPSDRDSAAAGQDAPRKRAKIEYDPESPALYAGQAGTYDEDEDEDEDEDGVQEQDAELLPSATGQYQTLISSTLVGDAAPKSPNLSLANGATQAVAPKTAVKQPVQNDVQPSAVKKPPEASSKPEKKKPSPNQPPEPLNPRKLAHSPAQHSARFKVLTKLYAEYFRLNRALKAATKEGEKELVMTDAELKVLAMDEEERIALKHGSMYANTMSNFFLTYKRMNVAKWKEERAAALQGAKGEKDQPDQAAASKIEMDLTPQQQVALLHQIPLVRSLGGLESYGYVAKPPTDEDMQNSRKMQEASANTELCDRCHTHFQVYPGRNAEGLLTSKGKCQYHPGRKEFLDKTNNTYGGTRTSKWACCGQIVDEGKDLGCETSQHHVFKAKDAARLATTLGFIETPANDTVPDDRAVCFDCEMGYTSRGLELIRVTALSWPDYEELLDVLVYPFGEVLDLNTRFSGVTIDHFIHAQRWNPGDDPAALKPTLVPGLDPADPPKRNLKIVKSPQVARDIFLTLISPRTPLLGHGLENDLNALRIVHPAIVDTVLLYPHAKGLPMRRGLRHLVDAHLKRRIQTDAAMGHDSAEDSSAAGDLVKLKLKSSWGTMRARGWRVKDGCVVPPPGKAALVVEMGGGDGGEWTTVVGSKRKAV